MFLVGKCFQMSLQNGGYFHKELETGKWNLLAPFKNMFVGDCAKLQLVVNTFNDLIRIMLLTYSKGFFTSFLRYYLKTNGTVPFYGAQQKNGAFFNSDIVMVWSTSWWVQLRAVAQDHPPFHGQNGGLVHRLRRNRKAVPMWGELLIPGRSMVFGCGGRMETCRGSWSVRRCFDESLWLFGL